MLTEQATALPSLSSVTKLVEAGSGGRSPPAAAPRQQGLRVRAALPPARRHRERPRIGGAERRRIACRTAKAAAAASPPSAGGGRNATLSRRFGSTMAGASAAVRR